MFVFNRFRQDGTEGEDWLIGAAVGKNGTVFLGGSTTGMWGDVQPGKGYDLRSAESRERHRIMAMAGRYAIEISSSGRSSGMMGRPAFPLHA